VVRCESKNGHQRDIICLNEIELCAQDLISIIDLKVKITGELIAFCLWEVIAGPVHLRRNLDISHITILTLYSLIGNFGKSQNKVYP
jgi:hypothetical protein